MRPSSSATVTVLALLAGACAAETSTDPAADLPLLVRGNTEFALTLFGRLGAESPEGNLFLSPLSVSAALGMTADGAGGGTAAQMDSVLRLAIPGGGARRAFPLLLSQLSPGHRAGLCGEGCEPLTLEIANALWVERSFPLLDTYVDLVGRDYGAVARNVDFVGDPEGQRLLINDWVDEATSGRITDLLPPGVITAMTRVVLTNAIYFKASWMTPFDERATAAADFTLPDGSVVAVPTMHRTDWFAFGRRGGCAAISLPYSDGMSSMLVLLPDGDLDTFEASLDAAALEDIRGGLQRTRIELSMPSFEFSSTFLLKETLIALGMTDAFDPALADFGGMTGGRDLYVGAVIHQAFVKVDEAGTEAAAATAVIMAMTAMEPLDPLRLRIDRPFVFLVVDDLTGSILFLGRVSDPR